MKDTLIFYAYDEDGKQVWCNRAVDAGHAKKYASQDTGIPQDNLSVERS